MKARLFIATSKIFTNWHTTLTDKAQQKPGAYKYQCHVLHIGHLHHFSERDVKLHRQTFHTFYEKLAQL